jgi:hypothetical protein
MANCIKCGNEYNFKRAELGYKTCLACGSPKQHFCVVPVNKSNYVIGTLAELAEGYSHKGPRP